MPAFEGRLKFYVLATPPDSWANDPEGSRTITMDEIEAGVQVQRLISDGGVTITPTANTASQALLDRGKVSHNAGTRERTGELRFEKADETAEDEMIDLFQYGDKRWGVRASDGEPQPGDIVQLYEFEVGDDPQFQPAARDTNQNVHVPMAIQEWDEKVEVVASTG